MASRVRTYQDDVTLSGGATRIYTICEFDAGHLVPRVELFEAVTDEEAVSQAMLSEFAIRREVWDRHRLVASILSASRESEESRYARAV